jgi:hypothetical protein
MGDMRNIGTISAENPKRRRRLETSKCKWRDNIKNDLKELR